MKMREKHDSFSSDDEVPLKLCTANNSDQSNSYKSLRQHSIEICEFCDKVFKNRYKSVVHNASHIIIPLINQKLTKCNECLYYFTSQRDYQKHVQDKHNKINGVAQEYAETKENRKEPFRMRNRFRYEDEPYDVSTNLLNLTTMCTVSLGILNDSFLKASDCKNPVVIDISDDEGPVLKNKYIIGVVPPIDNTVDKMCNSEIIEKHEVIRDSENLNNLDVEHYNSVHCDILKNPMLVKCRHCNEKFPNRYNLIIHEAIHIDFDRKLPHFCTICDWYIAGTDLDLKRHMKTHGPELIKKQVYGHNKKCLQCGLLYKSYLKHMNNYHVLNKEDDKYDKIIKTCDLCYEFLKSRTDRSYLKQGTISKVGKRYTCSQCMRKFFELNIVRMRQVLHNWSMKKKNKGKLTNRQRLEKIQHRLKQINKMRKM
ncbi:zinc finger protein 16-like [Battus philenor]|uniref:zinc finger protein 16-like n=1 Tax=Battus philenor TaxID=42288 RepID=UPI0035D0EC53